MVLAGGPFGLGPLELGLIVIAIVLVFGASRVSDMMGGVGKGIKEFKKNVRDDEDDAPAAPAAPIAPAAPVAPPPPVMSNGGPETVAAVKCPSCGALNPVSAKHCNQCGTALVAPVS